MKNAVMYDPRVPLKDPHLFFIVNTEDTFPPDHPHFDEADDDWYYEASPYDTIAAAGGNKRHPNPNKAAPQTPRPGTQEHNQYR
jgi:hypothetical protein